jgi:hypothetical protein
MSQFLGIIVRPSMNRLVENVLDCAGRAPRRRRFRVDGNGPKSSTIVQDAPGHALVPGTMCVHSWDADATQRDAADVLQRRPKALFLFLGRAELKTPGQFIARRSGLLFSPPPSKIFCPAPSAAL